MARPKNPDRIARENLITRTITTCEVTFRYVPHGGNEILTETLRICGNETAAIRTATKTAKELGTLIGEVLVTDKSEKLYGLSLDEFVNVANVLELNEKEGE